MFIIFFRKIEDTTISFCNFPALYESSNSDTVLRHQKSQSVKRGSIQVGVVGLDAADSSAVGSGGGVMGLPPQILADPVACSKQGSVYTQHTTTRPSPLDFKTFLRPCWVTCCRPGCGNFNDRFLSATFYGMIVFIPRIYELQLVW